MSMCHQRISKADETEKNIYTLLEAAPQSQFIPDGPRSNFLLPNAEKRNASSKVGQFDYLRLFPALKAQERGVEEPLFCVVHAFSPAQDVSIPRPD